MAILWTVIRITIDSEDQAPVEALDEFQFERLERYRAFGFRLYGFFGTLLAFLLIFGGMLWTPALSETFLHGNRLAVSLGYICLLGTMTIGGYPALALAWNKPDEE